MPKYVTEGSIVRDCAASCTEKTELGLGESWGTKVFCCKEDACNGAPRAFLSGSIVAPVALLVWQAVKITY
ncbi:hypothetical protein GE061_015146 [Apolygus lucorum]|uniref:Snake toxin/toxin-like domain-containing protein n=1 Tax=Apolygus lucorum TaxID=248454 RepID=A0A8S9XL99_APOLU|nr:hypothetical protein GE061_015146 [Apolygus lucorum]